MFSKSGIDILSFRKNSRKFREWWTNVSNEMYKGFVYLSSFSSFSLLLLCWNLNSSWISQHVATVGSEDTQKQCDTLSLYVSVWPSPLLSLLEVEGGGLNHDKKVTRECYTVRVTIHSWHVRNYWDTLLIIIIGVKYLLF